MPRRRREKAKVKRSNWIAVNGLPPSNHINWMNLKMGTQRKGGSTWYLMYQWGLGTVRQFGDISEELFGIIANEKFHHIQTYPTRHLIASPSFSKSRFSFNSPTRRFSLLIPWANFIDIWIDFAVSWSSSCLLLASSLSPLRTRPQLGFLSGWLLNSPCIIARTKREKKSPHHKTKSWMWRARDFSAAPPGLVELFVATRSAIKKWMRFQLFVLFSFRYDGGRTGGHSRGDSLSSFDLVLWLEIEIGWGKKLDRFLGGGPQIEFQVESSWMSSVKWARK